MLGSSPPANIKKMQPLIGQFHLSLAAHYFPQFSLATQRYGRKIYVGSLSDQVDGIYHALVYIVGFYFSFCIGQQHLGITQQYVVDTVVTR